MNSAYYTLQFGIVKMRYKDNILYYLGLTTEDIRDDVKSEFTDKVFREIGEYLRGDRKSFDIAYELEGSNFQKSVWHILEKIPYGETYTYLDVAKKLNNPKAVRAVGSACNRNPLWLIVPCHRVIGTSGKLVGYAWGINVKEEILQIESSSRCNR